MNHADVKKHLANYLEGDLRLDDRALVDAHLDECDQCSLEVTEMLQTIRMLRTLPEPEIPPMIAANVMRRIRAGESQPGFLGRVGRFLGSVLEPTFVLPASAIAVAALVFAVIQDTGLVPRGLATGDGVRISTSAGSRLTAALPTPVLRSRASQKRAGTATARSDAAVPTRIRIRIDGSGVSRLTMSRRSLLQQLERSIAANGPVFTSELPEAWAAEFARVIYGNRPEAAFGRLASAQRPIPSSNGLIRSAAVAPTHETSRATILTDLVSSGVDPRDAWLALGFEDPAAFAHYIARQNLAEQELWAARLSDRAEERGLMDDLLRTLRESGDATAIWVADDFAAQALARSKRNANRVEKLDQ